MIAQELDGSSLIKHLSVMVPMKDGVHLATEIFVPRTVEIRGTIVERTPYGRRPMINSSAVRDSFYRYIEHLCLNGFSVLMQDCRGTGDSEGAFVKYINEAEDGIATLEWAAEQEWWGKGAYLTGRSYSAHAALASAIGGASGILGMFLDCGGFWSAFHEGIRLNGAFEIKQATWALDAARRAAREEQDSLKSLALENQNIGHWLGRLPWRHGQSPLRFYKDRENALFELWDQGTYNDYWAQPSLSARGKADTLDSFPSLHISGWYDIYPHSTVSLFKELGSRNGGDAYMILGPWTHCALDEGLAGDVDFGPAATVDGAVGTDYLGMRTQWFNYCSSRAAPFGPRVRFFLMGGGSGQKVRGRLSHGGEWLSADQWPPANASITTWKLGPKGDLTQLASAEEAAVLKYNYDPTNPVPTIGGGVGSYPGILAPGAFDQREDPRFFGCSEPFMALLARPDILCFTSDQLAEDLAIAGAPVVSLDFTTSVEDTDITVKLIDSYPPSEQYPDGFAMNLCDTAVRLRCEDGLQLVAEDGSERTYRLEIEMPPIANLFAAGHSVRLDISSSNFPRIEANSNTLGSRGKQHVIATNGVVVGGKNGAALRLPVIPINEVPAMQCLT